MKTNSNSDNGGDDPDPLHIDGVHNTPDTALSEREIQAVILYMLGLHPEEAGIIMAYLKRQNRGLSIHTVNVHLANARSKKGVTSTAAVFAKAQILKEITLTDVEVMRLRVIEWRRQH